MNPFVLIAIGNTIVWGIIITLLFQLARNESSLKDKLAALEERTGGQPD